MSGKIRLLVVDDERELCDLLVEFFAALACEVTGAGGGAEAIALVERQEFDAVLTDIRMGNGDGIELLERLKDRDARVPEVALMSGYTGLPLSEIMDRGAVDLFDKTVAPAEILARLSWCRRPLATRLRAGWTDRAATFTTLIADLDVWASAGGLAFGRGGVFIGAAAAPPLDQLVWLDVRPAGHLAATLRLVGRCRWVRPHSSPHFHPGFGFELCGADDASLAVIQRGLRDDCKAYIPIGKTLRPTPR